MEINLTPEQIFALSGLTSMIVIVGRIVLEYLRKQKIKLPKIAMLGVVFSVSFLVSLIWFPQALPEMPLLTGDLAVDVMAVLGLITSGVSVLGGYTLGAIAIYKVALKDIGDALGEYFVSDSYSL